MSQSFSPPAARKRRQQKSVEGTLDTAFGWAIGDPKSMIVRAVFCALLLFVFAGPIMTIIVGAFDLNPDPTALTLWPHNPSLENFRVATGRGIWGYFANSLFIAGFGLLLQIIVAVMAGYALARRKFYGQTVVLGIFLATMMLPEEVVAVPLAVVLGDLPLLGISIRGTIFAIILPVAASAFSILVMAAFMRDIPEEIIEAARIDGASEFRILLQVILPMSLPALGVVAIFGFNGIWDQYLLPLVAANRTDDYTITVILRSLRADIEVGTGALLAGAFLALIPSLIVYLLLQKSLVRGMTSGAIKG
ncbi:carbohydrate ABC transporter membrane protein 2 (CUT1 family) [Pacificibacter maritimus]|uniref:Carbohydrate ABC transporter membrane protein 2 (CUT1 family) n=1 Tax=Pacificibacter maritimus TaxID=762213 RepID=A0A3N4UGE4_9RHOB|nr:carbohydrate ABC transporter permease [Pacificibacter maritimus]RPE66311.1 carbohydrate ABC transporter membrane protein 2 (CUT1 family) [Pacificibacter maritimus]